MGVGAGEPEGTDPGPSRTAVRLPRRRFLHDLDRQRVPRDVRVGVVEVQTLREELVLQRQDDLDQARDTGG